MSTHPPKTRRKVRPALAPTLLLVSLVTSACTMSSRTGTAWGEGAFASNGQRIYFTATSSRDTDIDSRGGPDMGGMMMGGELTCASCHGPDGRGGRHTMHMDAMDAPDIRWESLAGHTEEPPGVEGDARAHTDTTDTRYDIETFRLAVIEGLHLDGEPLDNDMPRWQMTDADLQDLVDYLQSLPGP